jgi:STAS domain
MPPEGANTLSISSGVRGTALVVRAVGELDYDYAPIFRREVDQIWSLGTGAPPPLSSGLASPLSGSSPLSPEAPSPLSPEAPSPFFPEAPSPLSPEIPSPLSPEAPSPLSPETPSPLSLSPPPEAPGTPLRPEALPWLILDLAGLTFCDSTGIAELLWILHRSQETGTRLVLAGVTRTLRHMLATTGLLPYFTLSPSVEDALMEAGVGTTEEQ